MISKPWWSIKRVEKHSYGLSINFPTTDAPRRVLLLADVHWDSANCMLKELKATLQEAKGEGAPVIIAGDFFDAMQGKWDHRASPDVLRPEHRGGCYLDLLVSTAAEWLKPYAENIALMSYGNHETGIIKRHEVDLLQRLCQELRREGSPVLCGEYWAFVKLHCKVKDLEKQKKHIDLFYHHGYGGGGEITRGLIDWSRTRGQYHADVYFSGHIHRRNQDENVITRVTSGGTIQQRKQLFLRASSWKDESSDGWHIQQGRAGRPIGGWWLEVQATCPEKHYLFPYRAIPT